MINFECCALNCLWLVPYKRGGHMVSAVCSPSLWQFRYETCLILRKRLENLARYTSAVTYCIGFVFSFLGTYVYIYIYAHQIEYDLLNEQQRKEAGKLDRQ